MIALLFNLNHWRHFFFTTGAQFWFFFIPPYGQGGFSSISCTVLRRVLTRFLVNFFCYAIFCCKMVRAVSWLAAPWRSNKSMLLPWSSAKYITLGSDLPLFFYFLAAYKPPVCPVRRLPSICSSVPLPLPGRFEYIARRPCRFDISSDFRFLSNRATPRYNLWPKFASKCCTSNWNFLAIILCLYNAPLQS